MLSRSFASLLLAAAVALTPGCASRVQPEYFEPSGDANIKSMPANGPRNTAEVTYGPEASMNVRASVIQGVASVQIILALRPGAQPLRFTGRRVVFEVGGTRDEREVMWDASYLENSRPRTERLAFDAELKPPNVALTAPQEGIVHLGVYQSTVVVPQAFQAAREFRLTIPAITGGAPVVLNFVRRGGQ